MSSDEALFFPLAKAFVLSIGVCLREGRKIRGMSYADRELDEALEKTK